MIQIYKAQEIFDMDGNSLTVTPPAHWEIVLKHDYTPIAQADYNMEKLNLDCGDNSCRYAKVKTGMRTNGGCRCEQKVQEGKKAITLLDQQQEKLAIACNNLGWDNSGCYDFDDLVNLISNRVKMEREEHNTKVIDSIQVSGNCGMVKK